MGGWDCATASLNVANAERINRAVCVRMTWVKLLPLWNEIGVKTCSFVFIMELVPRWVEDEFSGVSRPAVFRMRFLHSQIGKPHPFNTFQNHSNYKQN